MRNNLKEIREKENYSQLKLSYETRIASTDISSIERGKKFPYPGWRKKLAAALDVKEEEIFPGINE